jgi:hypothetical protein
MIQHKTIDPSKDADIMRLHNGKNRLGYLVIATVIFGPAGLIPFNKTPGIILSAIMISLIALLYFVYNIAPFAIKMILIVTIFWVYSGSVIIAVYHDDILGNVD